MCGFDISHVRNELESMIEKGPKMDRKWSQNPQKSPPEGDLKAESPKMVKNDPKLPPKGSQMETPGVGKNGNRGVRRTLLTNWSLDEPLNKFHKLD